MPSCLIWLMAHSGVVGVLSSGSPWAPNTALKRKVGMFWTPWSTFAMSRAFPELMAGPRA